MAYAILGIVFASLLGLAFLWRGFGLGIAEAMDIRDRDRMQMYMFRYDEVFREDITSNQ